jgi:hypothetical protein
MIAQQHVGRIAQVNLVAPATPAFVTTLRIRSEQPYRHSIQSIRWDERGRQMDYPIIAAKQSDSSNKLFKRITSIKIKGARLADQKREIAKKHSVSRISSVLRVLFGQHKPARMLRFSAALATLVNNHPKVTPIYQLKFPL